MNLSRENLQEMHCTLGMVPPRNTMRDTLHTMRPLMEECVASRDQKSANNLLMRVVTTLLQRTYHDEQTEVYALLDAYEDVGERENYP